MKLNKNMIKVVCFSLIFCVLFLNVQETFIQKKMFARGRSEPNTNIIGGFYEEKKDSLDVLFIGTSNMFCNVNPLILFKNEGISSYILGTSSQQLDASYFFLKEGLKRQTPKVVVVGVRSIIYQDKRSYSEAYNHYVFDHVPFSLNKLEGINNSLEIAENDNIANYILPIIKYHSRWKELNKDDLSWRHLDKKYPLKGYYARYDSKETSYAHYNEEGAIEEITQRNQYYLSKIIEECKNNNIDLLFLKAPMADMWRQDYSDLMTDFLTGKPIPFLDYNELREEIGLDEKADFFDDGKHLNDKGATKVSLHLGSYLKEHYDLPDHRGEKEYESWNNDWQVYQQDKAAYFLSHETDWKSYLCQLKNPNYTIYISVKDDVEAKRNSDLIAQLKILGLKENIYGKDGFRYQAIIDKGSVVYEKATEEDLSYATEVNGQQINMVSSDNGSIKINSKEYFVDHQGIGFVVYDNIFNEVVDSVTFDLCDGGKAFR